MKTPDKHRGRGANVNPAGRFETLSVEFDPESPEDERPAPGTRFFRDASKTVLTTNDSPDVGMEVTLNPYRGCEHGCSYCYARPTHEYLGFSAGLDFETRIMVKEDAPELLRKELSKKSWKPRVISFSGITDAYQPVERRLMITRRCLEVLAECRNPAAIVTKNHLVTRDLDILKDMAKWNGAAVFVSITSLDGELQRRLEPRASHPKARLETLKAVADAGVFAGVMVAPVIPGLNDHEIPAILKAAAAEGAKTAGYVLLRLPYGVKDVFTAWLERHYPDRKEKVLSQIRQTRSGELNDARFGSRMRGEGPIADAIEKLFKLWRKKAGLDGDYPELATDAFRKGLDPSGRQPELFEPS